ncbi:MAG: DUF2470 domain-containing protein [Pseudomonadota bacterium]
MTDSKEPNTRLPINDEVRSQARTLIRTARHGALALIGDDGAPSVARVGLATDTNGLPVFPVSSLSGRVDDMHRDGRASLLVGQSGNGDVLAHSRLSMNGHARRLDGDEHRRARRRYLERHPKADLYIDFADFSLWCLEVTTVSFVRGFGHAYAMDARDITTELGDWTAWNGMEAGAVEHMNDDHLDATALYATVLLGADEGDWRITGLDPHGIDLASGDEHRRYEYETPLESAAELRPALVDLVRVARSKGTAEN